MTISSLLGRCALVFAFSGAMLLSPVVLAKSYPLDQVLPTKAASSLKKAGIADTKTLLTQGKNAKARRALAKKAGFALQKLEGWVWMSDLLRVPGVGPQMAALLGAAKVRSVARLKRQRPKDLHRRMLAANQRSNISENPPVMSQVAHWIKAARKLRVVAR